MVENDRPLRLLVGVARIYALPLLLVVFFVAARGAAGFGLGDIHCVDDHPCVRPTCAKARPCCAFHRQIGAVYYEVAQYSTVQYERILFLLPESFLPFISSPAFGVKNTWETWPHGQWCAVESYHDECPPLSQGRTGIRDTAVKLFMGYAARRKRYEQGHTFGSAGNIVIEMEAGPEAVYRSWPTLTNV